MLQNGESSHLIFLFFSLFHPQYNKEKKRNKESDEKGYMQDAMLPDLSYFVVSLPYIVSCFFFSVLTSFCIFSTVHFYIFLNFGLLLYI